MATLVRLDSAWCESLMVRVLEDDAVAWQLLLEHIWPHLLRQIGATPCIRVRGTEDEARNVATQVLEKLRRDGCQALRCYFDWKGAREGRSFQDWLFIVSANAARDHVRAQTGGRPKATWEGPSPKRLLNELAATLPLDDVGERPPVTTNQTARQVLEVARRSLTGSQYAALELWLQGHDPADIAGALGSADEETAIRLLRSAIAVLRRLFAKPPN